MDFVYPEIERSWFPKKPWADLVAAAQADKGIVDRTPPSAANVSDFLFAQNGWMLKKFFLQQAFGGGLPFGRTLKLIDREFGGVDEFHSRLWQVGSEPRVGWIAWCLSYATGRFHIFPVYDEVGGIPFCTSPMLVLCLADSLVADSGVSRAEFISAQIASIDYEVVERRIACLEKPLDVFEEMADCQADSCGVV
jgi:superoxide dismutase